MEVKSTSLCHDRSTMVDSMEYRSDDVTKIYFWNFKILTIWSERAPYNRHTSKVSDI